MHRSLKTLLPALLLAAWSACVSIPPPNEGEESGDDAGALDGGAEPDADPRCVDEDGDGYLPEGCEIDDRLPFDCDTTRGDVHPGAFNDCEAGEVLDCSGMELPCFSRMSVNEFDFQPNGLRISNASMSIFFDEENRHTVSELFNRLADKEYIYDNRDVPDSRYGTILGPASNLVADSPLRNESVLGKGVVQLRVSWSSSDLLAGKSIYSIYPDGRVHLREELTVDGASMTHDSMRTHLALDPAAFSAVLATGDPAPTQIGEALTGAAPAREDLLSRGSSSTQGMFCAFDGESASSNGIITMGWKAPFIPPSGGAHLRKALQLEDDEATYRLSFDFDWFDSSPVVPDTYVANFQFYLGLAPFTNEQACKDGEAHFEGFFNPPTILEGTEPTVGGLGDEDEDGYNEGLGHYQFTLQDTKTLRFTLAGDADFPPSIAVRIDQAPDTDPSVFVEDEILIHGRDYLYDTVDLGKGESEGRLFINQAGLDRKEIRVEYP